MRGSWRHALLALLIACSSPAPSPTLSPLPGAEPFDGALADRLAQAQRDHRLMRPRTPVRSQHLRTDGSPQFINRLVLEDSPYLQQHAYNPVNWFPWGDEAFAEAKRLGRPVLLSIGYSTCHWCHVMEEESFDDVEVATLINQRYVAIKVDREERPDLDALYMGAVVRMSGSGGWPMTLWLTPDRAPFWAGTYFPPNDGDRGVARGLRTLLTTLADTYAADPAQAATAAASVVAHLQAEAARPTLNKLPDATVLEAMIAATRRGFDNNHGGLAARRKFPSSTPLRALLRYYRRTRDPDALRMVTLTLDHMAAGGIRDQLGGAFHRYSTDPQWRVPHFEIMLYDNALLALTYLDAYQATGKAAYARIVREILDYLAATMQAPGGGFWSATDADSPNAAGERVEGQFFTWTPDELRAVLNDGPVSETAARHFGVTAAGDVDGRSVLRIADDDPVDPITVIEPLRRARAQRVPPAMDRKLVTAWNGLAISAFARAAVVLDAPGYATVATRAADVLWRHRTTADRLPRRLVRGRSGPPAVLDDYACLIAGMLDLLEATGNPRWLVKARRLDTVVAAHFEDATAGGFFLTPDDGEALLVRDRPREDNAEPAGNSVMAMNLLRLAELTGDAHYRQRAERTIAAAGELLQRAPLAGNEMLLAVDFLLDTPREIVIVVSPDDGGAAPFLDILRNRFLPNRVLLVIPLQNVSRGAHHIGLLADKTLLRGRTTAYVCERQVCALPTAEPDAFAAQIATVQPLRP